MLDVASLPKKRAQIKVTTLHAMKARRELITALSIYDCPFAEHANQGGLEIIIIGDSLGMTVMGYGNTLPVTMDQMITFASAACRGAGSIFTVGDLPFNSYQSSDEQAVHSAARFIKEAGCAAVKCEASMKLMRRFEAIANAEILVMGHIGLNPQKIHEMGGYRIQGKTLKSTLELLKTARTLESAGAFAILLEGVTEEVAGIIRDELSIPVLGIASGRRLDGQLLIGHDLFGLTPWESQRLPLKEPKYIFRYQASRVDLTIGEYITDAVTEYVGRVKTKRFPEEKNVHHVDMAQIEQEVANANSEERKQGEIILERIAKLEKLD